MEYLLSAFVFVIVVLMVFVLLIRAILRINVRVKLLNSINTNLEKLFQQGERTKGEEIISIKCPKCSANLKGPASLKGKNIRCVKCLKIFTVKVD